MTLSNPFHPRSLKFLLSTLAPMTDSQTISSLQASRHKYVMHYLPLSHVLAPRHPSTLSTLIRSPWKYPVKSKGDKDHHHVFFSSLLPLSPISVHVFPRYDVLATRHIHAWKILYAARTEVNFWWWTCSFETCRGQYNWNK